MIWLCDLSPLMQRTIEKDITFMVSKSGLPNRYNLGFAKFVSSKGNTSMNLTYCQDEGIIYQYADKTHPEIAFKTVNDVLDFVENELLEQNITREAMSPAISENKAETGIIEWDKEGYPTRASLQQLQEALEDKEEQALAAFYAALKENFYPDYCRPELIEVRGKVIGVWAYHTLGWSGNEAIIAVLKESLYFDWLLERYDSGGHYYFRIYGER